MKTEAQHLAPTGSVELIADQVFGSGDVIQLADGRAAVKEGLRDNEVGDVINVRTEGRFKIKRKTGITFLPGQEAWFSIADGAATYALDGDFRLGPVIDQDAVSSGDAITIDLNAPRFAAIEQLVDEWEHQATNGDGVTNLGGAQKLSFDTTSEAAQAALLSKQSVAIGDGAIFEAEVAIYDVGGGGEPDFDFGLASAAHATDFESVSEFVAFHVDGNSLNISAHSKDGANDVAITDTTKDAVDDTYAFFQIDTTDPADVKLYINGARVLSGTTFRLDNASGPLKLIAMVEKTSSTTSFDARVKNSRVYKRTLAAA